MPRIRRVIEQDRMWKEAEKAMRKKMRQHKEGNKVEEHNETEVVEQTASSSTMFQRATPEQIADRALKAARGGAKSNDSGVMESPKETDDVQRPKGSEAYMKGASDVMSPPPHACWLDDECWYVLDSDGDLQRSSGSSSGARHMCESLEHQGIDCHEQPSQELEDLKESVPEPLEPPETPPRIWIRGSLTWLPIRWCDATTFEDVRSLIAIHLKTHAMHVRLIWNEKLMPQEGRCSFHLPAGMVELVLAKAPYILNANRPKGPLPALDDVDGRCEACQNGALCLVKNEEHNDGRPKEVEIECMKEEDFDVHYVTLQYAKNSMLFQYSSGSSVEKLVEVFAKSKKLGKHRLHPYRKLQMDEEIRDGDCVMLTSSSGRGGVNSSVFVKNENGWVEIAVDEMTTIEQVRNTEQVQGRYLVYKGATAHDWIKVMELQESDFEVQDEPAHSMLRPRRHCAVSQYMHLAELQEWYMCKDEEHYVAGSENRADSEERIQLALVRWQQHQRNMMLQLKRDGRAAGGPRTSMGRLPWESTRTIKGLQLAVTVSVEDTKLGMISADEITETSSGVALILMSTWSKVKDILSEKPLVALLPGRCTQTMARLGADTSRCAEFDLLFKEPQEGKHIKRMVTAYRLSKHVFSYGEDMKGVNWTPQASVEVCFELDERWCSDPVKSSACSSWKDLLMSLAGQMCLEVIPEENLYALRAPGPLPPRLWTARGRFPQAVAEKLFCASGLEGMFIRPQNPCHSG